MEVTNRQVRLSDIAELAGVSKVTVSKVLSGSSTGNSRVGAETRRRVREIASSLGYRTNMTARILAGKSSKAIGMLLDAASPASHLRRLAMLEREARRNGFRLMVGQCHPELENIVELFDDFASRGVDGVISLAHIYPNIGRQVIDEFSRRHVPVVYFDDPFSGEKGMPVVDLDFEYGIELAVRHLHRIGRRRILLFMPRQNIALGRFHYMTKREEGYRRVTGELGLPEMIYPSDLRQFIAQIDVGAITRMFVTALEMFKPDAVVAQNDSVGALVLRHCLGHGINVPGDLAVVGFDNMDFSEYTYPSLSTIDSCVEEACGHVIGMMMELIKNGKIANHKVAVPPKLILRESTMTNERDNQ